MGPTPTPAVPMNFEPVTNLFETILSFISTVIETIFTNPYLAVPAGALIAYGLISMGISVFKKIASNKKS